MLKGRFEVDHGDRTWWQRLLMASCSAVLLKEGNKEVLATMKQALFRRTNEASFLFAIGQRQLELHLRSHYPRDGEWRYVLIEDDKEVATVRNIGTDWKSGIEFEEVTYEDDIIREGPLGNQAVNHELRRDGQVVARALVSSYFGPWPRIEVLEELKTEVVLLLLTLYRGATQDRRRDPFS